MRRDAFRAIADPTRRDIIDLLTPDLLNLNDVAKKFTISRPAISNHIKMLNECGLVVFAQYGRERFCKARPENLREAAKWINQYRIYWDPELHPGF